MQTKAFSFIHPRLALLLLALVLQLSACGGSAATSPDAAPADVDPLSGDTVVHDPTLFRSATDWYVFSTGAGIQRLKSTDGLKWDRVGRIFPADALPAWWKQAVPAMGKPDDVWAPDAFAYGGRSYLFYAISSFGTNGSAIGLASANSFDDVTWKDEGLVIKSTSSDNFNAIDPDFFLDPNGDPWMVFGSFWDGIRLTRLDKTTLRPTGSLTALASRVDGIEAPSLLFRDGWYYLFVSIDKCCAGVNSTYRIAVGRSRAIDGPYLDDKDRKMLSGFGKVIESSKGRWVAAGGEDIWGNTIVRHAYDAQRNGEPHLRISDLSWTADGWPQIN